MSGTEYIVDFQEPVYESDHKKPPHLEIISFVPAKDSYFPAPTPFTNLFPEPFGNMFVGQSVPYPAGPGVPLTYFPVPPLPHGSIILEVKPDPNALPIPGGTTPYPESRTLFVHHDWLLSLQGKFGSISAEVQFNLPYADPLPNPDPVAPDSAWAVGLVLKDGTAAEEQSPDKSVITTCQFINGGNVNFHNTDFINNPVDTRTYPDYAHTVPTQFRLSMTIYKKPAGVTGVASLQLDNKPAFSGSLSVANLASFDSVTNIGISVVSTKNLLPKFKVHIQRFAFRIDYDA
jgi:hypothetical protein